MRGCLRVFLPGAVAVVMPVVVVAVAVLVVSGCGAGGVDGESGVVLRWLL